jgi:aminoglycoside phosphotransferase (APT) family kinase protein
MNVADIAAWHDALAQVPGSAMASDITAQHLAGGTTNATFRVETGQGVFVIRLHEPYSVDLGIDRRREAVLHAAAAAAGLTSRIVAADPHGRYLVTEFLHGAPWQIRDLEDESCLRQLARTLAELHALPAPAVAPLDVPQLLQRHVAQICAQDAGAADALAPQLARAQDILARQADAGRPACIVHGDLSHANVIGFVPPRLVDWEYAAVGDPLTDLACLVAYYPQLLPYGSMLLSCCGMIGSVGLPALQDLAWVYALLSTLWNRRLELARRHPPPAH